MRGDTKAPGCDVPVFQLLQWKHAIRLEATCAEKGWPAPFPRSVWAHAKRKLGVKGSREKVVAHIQGILDRYQRSRLEQTPPQGGEPS
jgi:hypothetical protein